MSEDWFNEPAIMDDDDAQAADEGVPNHLRMAALTALDERFKPVFEFLRNYNGNKRMAIECAIFALGWYHMVGARTQVELSMRVKMYQPNSKAAVNNCVKKLQRILGVIGERDKSACQRMKLARKQQLKKTTK